MKEKFIVDRERLSKVWQEFSPDNVDKPLHVAVIFGGMSAEREVSIMSGNVVLEQIKQLNYKVTAIDVGVDIAEVLRKVKPDVVFNSLHGTFGEDGCIQGMLDILGIPYTHSGVLASSLALNKLISQDFFANNGIKCPNRIIIAKGDDLSAEPISRPYVIKPLDQGSSLGVEVIFAEDDFNLANYAFAYGDRAIIEDYITGQEIQVAVLKNKAIGTLEIECLQGKRFNDYECKYVEGFARHIVPANVSDSANKKMLLIAEKVHALIGCKGVTRVEFRYDPDEDEAYFIEINTHPGLTLLSSAPDILKHNGISFPEFLKIMIDDALDENKK